MASNSEAANIYSAVNGYTSVADATADNAAIASAVTYGTVPSLYLTNSFSGDGAVTAGKGYYWGDNNK